MSEAPRECVLALLTRPEGRPLDGWNSTLLRTLGPTLCERQGIAEVALQLVDAEAQTMSPAVDVTRERSFDALLELTAPAAAAMGALEVAAEDAAAIHAYRVLQRRVMRYARDWPDGERTPGVFMVSPVYRAATLDHAGFDAHWEDRHRPLAVRHHVGMWDYRQGPVVEVLTPGSPRFDGITHMGFPSAEAFRTGLFDSAEGQRLIMADTERFLTLDRSESAFTGEYVLRSQGASRGRG